MLRYTVTATLLPEHAPSYEAWLREGHVQAVLELGAAFSAEVILLDRDDGKTAIQASYLFPSREVFDAYVAGPATILRQDGLKLWAETGKVLEWARSTGIVRATFPPEEIARGTGGAVVPVPGKREWPELVGRLWRSCFYLFRIDSTYH